MTPIQRGRISPMLKQGLGAEDIAIRLGVEYHEIKRAIAEWRLNGMIYDICGTSRVKTHRMLGVMRPPTGAA